MRLNTSIGTRSTPLTKLCHSLAMGRSVWKNWTSSTTGESLRISPTYPRLLRLLPLYLGLLALWHRRRIKHPQNCQPTCKGWRIYVRACLNTPVGASLLCLGVLPHYIHYIHYINWLGVKRRSRTPATRSLAFESIVMLATRYIGLRWLFDKLLAAELGSIPSESDLSAFWMDGKDVADCGDSDWKFLLSYAAYCITARASDHVTLAIEECIPSQFGRFRSADMPATDSAPCVSESLPREIHM